MLDTSETREEKKSTSDTTEDRDNELEKQDNQQIELSLASLTDKAGKTESLRGALSRRGLIQDTPADKAAKTDDSLVDPKTDKPGEKSTLPELSIETTSSETGRETEVDGEKDVDLAPPRASERPPFRPGAVIDTSKLPEKMKSGTGSDAWARVSPTERREVALKMQQLTGDMINASNSVKPTEKTASGLAAKKDEQGRTISVENPKKDLRMHFKYEGDSKTVSAFVMENTKTKEKRTFVALGDGESGKREWLSLDSKGRAGTYRGDATTGGAGHRIKLEPRGPSRELLPPEKLADKPGSAEKKSELETRKEQLAKIADSAIKNPKERDAYLKDLDRFQTAAKTRGVSEREVTDFFKESAKLLSARSGATDAQQRTRLARESLKQAIDPTSVTQGEYNTCNVSAVEVSMYTRNPSKVMKAITEAALTGKFTTSTGSKVELDRSTFQPKAMGRSFASQVFQDLAINSYWTDKGYKEHKPGEIKYKHDGGKATETDSGQRLTATDSATGKKKVISSSPFLGVDDYPEIYKKIAGTRPDTVALAFADGRGEVKGVKNIDSQRKLEETLTELSRKPGSFPVILRIHTSNPPFWKDSGEGGAGGAGVSASEAKKTDKIPGGWHVVTIHGYNPRTGEVAVDNTWDLKSDHLGKRGDGGKLPLKDLYNAMRLRPERLEELGYTPKKKR